MMLLFLVKIAPQYFFKTLIARNSYILNKDLTPTPDLIRPSDTFSKGEGRQRRGAKIHGVNNYITYINKLWLNFAL
ncbi:MAG: hypothetical protein NTX03_12280 [Bacteroidetes bacterium]|nr:hypothetical protein [Bacteroidota bacterium]